MARISVDTMVVLGKCAEIELKSMELYDLYADCFEHDVDVARMWRKVAREEENHANQFRLAVMANALPPPLSGGESPCCDNYIFSGDDVPVSLRNLLGRGVEVVGSGVREDRLGASFP